MYIAFTRHTFINPASQRGAFDASERRNAEGEPSDPLFLLKRPPIRKEPPGDDSGESPPLSASASGRSVNGEAPPSNASGEPLFSLKGYA